MKKTLIAGAAGLVLASGVGLGLTQVAQAETTNPTPTISASATAEAGDTTASEHRGGARGHGGRGIDTSGLATALGLPEATVSEALTAVRDQTDTTRPSSDATEAEKDATKEARQTEFATALAAELNVDEADVTTALAEVRTEREAAQSVDEKATLDQAVTDGTLTQTEADGVQKAIDEGIVSTRGGGHGRR